MRAGKGCGLVQQSLCRFSGRWHRGVKTHAAVALLLALLTALFVALTVVDTGAQHASRRAIWLSVLMGAARLSIRLSPVQVSVSEQHDTRLSTRCP